MANELAHRLTSEALQDFDQINPDHSGVLNLVDIAKYEKLGPRQKEVGQFLADNYDAMHKISESQPFAGDNTLTKQDLVFVNLFSGNDQTAKQNTINTDAAVNGVMMGLTGAAVAILPGLPIEAVASMAGPVGTVGAAIAVEGGAAYLGYSLGSQGMKDFYKDQQAVVDRLKP